MPISQWYNTRHYDNISKGALPLNTGRDNLNKLRVCYLWLFIVYFCNMKCLYRMSVVGNDNI